MARFEIPAGFTVGLLATMPRSGTWYSFYFFEFLDIHLSGRQTLNTRMDLEIYPSLKLGKISVHSICPGFPELCRGPLKDKWDELDFYVDGYNYGYQKFIGNNIATYSPELNSGIRIIYLYRNPLDQAVSYFRHARHNKNEHKTVHRDDDGSVIEMTSASQFLRMVGLEAYIKQYFTFEAMRTAYGENILMVPYERLVRDPEPTFTRMLEFWGFDVDTAGKQSAVQKALQSCSPESLRNIETALQSSLARDQMKPGESHIRGGEIGKWKSVLSDADVDFAKAQLAEFGISLDDFEIS